MIKTEPFSSIREISSFVELCLKPNFLSAPKLTDAIAEFSKISFSLSECQLIASEPLLYKFNKQELNVQPEISSTVDFMETKKSSQFSAILVLPEYL